MMRRTGGATLSSTAHIPKEEIIGGFQIQAENYDKAVAIAGDCPHLDYGTIEIREVEMIVTQANA